jgi:ornithine cyclodeaminase/alanine dehydrogenase-like protein (mu-crystallin family)
MVMFLGEAEVRELLDWKPLIAAMETALTEFSAGRVIQPVRNMLTIEEGKRYLGIMPAVAEDAMGLKLVCFYPGNAGTSVPTHTAMILLFRPETGEPLAVMDGRLITEMRTAAVSAAVTNRLASPESRVMALLGSGVQAKAHLEAIQQVRPMQEVRVWSQTPEHAKRFAHANNAIATDAENAVRGADIVVTATIATANVARSRR